MSKQYRWYQEEAIASIFDYFKVSKGNPVVAMPTGTGKSLVIAGFTHRAFLMYPGTRILSLTHVKELIQQNYEELIDLWPTAPAGIYAAGLRRKDTHLPIIFGSIQSVANNIEAFGRRDLVIVDECHLLSPDENTTYQRVLAELKKYNPFLKVIGLSATPWRMGLGHITEGGIFTDVCYDITGLEAFNRLVDEEYMKPLLPRPTRTTLNVDGVGIVNGDYNKTELQQAVNKREVTLAALQEACDLGQDRNCWLVFASGIEHAEEIADILNSFSVSTVAVHSKIRPTKKRDEYINAYKRGEYKCLVGQNIFTTGFNHKPIDYILMLRPTLSPGLWVQMLGRGTRPTPYAQNCVVLDFAKNCPLLGPINDPRIPKRKGKGGGDMPVKICETCGTYNHISARICIACKADFDIAHKLFTSAGEVPLLVPTDNVPIIEWINVDRMVCSKHQKDGAPASIKVHYHCGLVVYNEWHHLERTGFAGKQARDWWRRFARTEPPTTTDEALRHISQLRTPKRVNVWVNKRPYPEVKDYEF